MKTTTLYSEVPVNSVFKVLKEERRGQRVIKNNGTYIKRGESHSTEIHTECDSIFTANTPCRVIKLGVKV